MPSRESLFDAAFATRAARELSRRDPRLAHLAEQHGPALLGPPGPGGAFGYLARSILHQQLASAAARTITARAVARCGERGRLTPESLLAAGEDNLRACGVSRPKIRTLLALAHATLSGEVVLTGLNRQSDDAIIERLVTVPGIGPWTVQMLLIFHLGRPDVFPENDLAVREGVRALVQEAAPLKPRTAAAIAEAWAPHRSTVSWWMWRHRSGKRPGIA